MEQDTESFCSSRASEALVNRKTRQKVEVYHEIVQKLRERDDEEINEPGFEDELWAHFDRLPVRYAMDVNVERPEDVLVHKKLLHLAYDSTTRPAFHLRLVQVVPASDVSNGDSEHSMSRTNTDVQSSDSTLHDSIHPPFAFGLSPNLEHALEVNKTNIQVGEDGNLPFFRHLYEITISTIDKPKLLSQLTSLFSEIGLNIKEAHAFSTTDGYSLDVFVVDAWTYAEKDQLKNALKMELPKIEMLYRSRHNVRDPDPDHVNIPSDGNDAWEIDPELLKCEHRIAGGAYGDLYKGSFHGQDVAIKVLKPSHLDQRVQREFAQEVYILRRVRHKNVVQFIGACTRPPTLCVVTEFMSRGSVYDFMHKQKGHFKLPALLKVALDVSKGMNYLHENNIIHRDLKAANLLMDENEVVKVADFGVARVKIPAGVMTAETGTYRWMAPEVIEHKPYDHKADIFSFGIVVWELLTGKLPYEHLTPLQAAVGVVQKVTDSSVGNSDSENRGYVAYIRPFETPQCGSFKHSVLHGLRPSIPKRTHPDIIELLEKCWQRDPASRPEFSEIIEILQKISDKVGEEERAVKRRTQGGQ